MPLVVDQLQLWSIGFKWSGLDPQRVWLRIPAPVRDNFSALLEAILRDELSCLTLAPEKYRGDDPLAAAGHIRYWIEEVYAGIEGRHYSRKLMKWAILERGAFQQWCERRTIPLPDFWFPPGWTDYRWPEYDEPEAMSVGVALPSTVEPDDLPPSNARQAPPDPDPESGPARELRASQIARIASQQIARAIWKDHPDQTIAAMCKEDLIQKYGGAQYYAEEVVRRWIKEVASPKVSAKRGRPKKINPTEDG